MWSARKVKCIVKLMMQSSTSSHYLGHCFILISLTYIVKNKNQEVQCLFCIGIWKDYFVKSFHMKYLNYILPLLSKKEIGLYLSFLSSLLIHWFSGKVSCDKIFIFSKSLLKSGSLCKSLWDMNIETIKI